MNREQIIAMALEAKADYDNGVWSLTYDELERFSTIVAAVERERLKWDGLHSCHPECDRPACVHTRQAMEAEREACAQIAFNAKTYLEAAKAIRARGKE